MKIIIHRGTHQIGGSCIELSAGSTRIILDAGQVLPPLNGESSFPPILPKVDGLYINDRRSVDAVLFSHYHGDHVGLIEHIHPDIPVYMGEATAKVLNMTARFVSTRNAISPAGYFVSGQVLRIGSFTITPFLVDHSAYDAYAFIIEADNKKVIYSGDLRMHGNKAKATRYFLEHMPWQVDALLLEGTMMSRKDEVVKTEKQIEHEAYILMQDLNRRVFVIQSSTNIDRLVSIYRAARRSNRLFVIDIFTANMVNEIGERIPNPITFEDVKVFYPYRLTQHMFGTVDGSELMNRFSSYKISREELDARQDYCMLIRSSMLSDLKHLNNNASAMLIHSLWRGNLQIKSTQMLMEYAKEQEMDIVQLHTTGHADVKALNLLVAQCKPKMIIPIHTECPEAFAVEFDNVRILQDGECVTLN